MLDKLSIDTVMNAGLLAIAGILAASMRNLPYKLVGALKRMTVITLVVDSRSDLFAWLIGYFNDLPYTERCRLLTASSKPDTLGHSNSINPERALLITPAPGFHLFFHGRRLVWITRELSAGQHIIETVKVSTPGFRRDYLNTVLANCIDRVRLASVGRTALYVVDRWAENWMLSTLKRKRPLSTVVVEGDGADFRNDVAQFLRAEDWYVQRGIPWRRG